MGKDINRIVTLTEVVLKNYILQQYTIVSEPHQARCEGDQAVCDLRATLLRARWPVIVRFPLLCIPLVSQEEISVGSSGHERSGVKKLVTHECSLTERERRYLERISKF